MDVAVVEPAVRAGHNSMTYVDTPRDACLGSTRRIREATVLPVRSDRDQSVIRRLQARIDLSVPPANAGRGRHCT